MQQYPTVGMSIIALVKGGRGGEGREGREGRGEEEQGRLIERVIPLLEYDVRPRLTV